MAGLPSPVPCGDIGQGTKTCHKSGL